MKNAARRPSRCSNGATAAGPPFLPMNTIRGKRMNLNGLERQPGFVGIASALVETAPEYEEILENLLGRTVIAETLDHAIRMARPARTASAS